MSSAITPLNPGNSLTLKQAIYDSSHVNALANGFTTIENQVLLNMAQGVSAQDISTGTTNPNTCVSRSSYKGDIMVNNTSIDTPNLAMISQYTSTQFEPVTANLTMGTNSYGGSSHNYAGYIADLSQSIVYINETLHYDFSDNTTPSTDATGRWSVSFTDTSNNARMTRAANSYLNARNYSGTAVNPFTITEPSFNYNYALANKGNSAFNNQFTVNDAIGVPSRSALTGNNLDSQGNQLLNLTYNANNYDGYYNEYGTFQFEVSQDGPVTNKYSDLGNNVSVNNLPFGYKQNSGSVQSLPNDIASNFDTWFNNPPSNTTFDFSVNAQAGTGVGYYNVDAPPYSKEFYDANGDVVFSIDDSALRNSATYVAKGYAARQMTATVTNGSLSLSSGLNTDGNGNLTLGSQYESLPLQYTSVSGEIDLRINNPNNRTSYTGTDFSGIIVVYPGENSGQIQINNGVTNTNGSLATDYLTTDQITVSTQQILNGYTETDVFGGYSYSGDATKYISDADSQTVLYSATPDVSLSYSVSGSFGSDVAELIIVNSIQGLVDPSSNTLWAFTTDQSGTTGNTGYMQTASGPLYISSSNQNPFINPTLTIHNIVLSDFSYVNYRGLLEPKKFSDLCGNGIVDISCTLSGSPSQCQLVMGTVELSGHNLYVFTPSTPQYALTSSSNLKDALGTGAQGMLTGITKQNLAYGDDRNHVYSIGFSYGNRHNSTFSDTMTYTFNTDFIDPGNNTFTNYSPSGNTVTFDTIANQTQDNTFFVQLPIGHYINLYMKTPALTINTVNGVETLATPLQGTISFTLPALESLWFKLQGTTDASASYTDVDVSGRRWITISTDPNNASINRVGVEAYENQPSNFNVPDAVSGTPGQGVVSLATINASQQVTYTLSNPGYAIRAVNDPSNTSYSIYGARFPTTGDILDSVPSGTTAGLYQLSSYFNPADFPVPSYTGIAGGVDLNPQLTVSNNGTTNIFTINTNNGQTFTISSPYHINRDFSIWYCPQDVYDVSVDGTGGTGIYVQNQVVQSGDIHNKSAQLVSGVYLYGTQNLVPSTAPDRYEFNINGDYIAVNMVHGLSTGNNYEEPSPIEITDANGGLSTGYNGTTRSLNFNYYRGYETSSGVSGELQVYTINRTQTTMQLSNTSNQSGVTAAQTRSFVLGTDRTNYDASFVTVDASGYAFDINLLFNVSESMLPSANYPTTTYTIGVDADTVTVTENNVLQTTTNLTNASIYTLSGGITIVPERILVQSSLYGDSNGVAYEVYGVHRDTATLNIGYTDSYDGAPSGQSYGDFTSVSVTDLETTGFELTQNLYIAAAGAPGKNYYPAPSATYLVAPPPYAVIRGLGYNAAGTFPFNYGPSGSLVSYPSGGYDASKNYVQYTPITAPGSGETFNPSSDLQSTITSPNNGGDMLNYYVTGTSTDVTYQIIVNGNHLRLIENTSGYSKTLFNDNMDATLAGFLGGVTYTPESVLYDLSYSQDLRSIGSIAAGPTVYLEISGAFNVGSGDITLNPSNATSPYLYGVAPYRDTDGNYALSLYKYSPGQSANYLAVYNYNTLDPSSTQHVLPFYAVTREYKHISMPALPFCPTPYNLATQLAQIQLSDISNQSWIQDTSFNAEQLNFEIVALDISGISLLQALVTTTSPQSNVTILGNSYQDVNVNAAYFTLPDILTATSTDGAPVFRILYNGTLVAPAISASQVSLMPLPSNDALNTLEPNQEFVNFNVGTNTSTYDNSGAMVAP